MTESTPFSLSNFIEQSWYRNAAWLKGFSPISSVFSSLAKQKKQQAEKNAWQAPVPVIVVGNISVGGTGKTPLVIAVAQRLKAQGYRPGIVSRGYRSKAPHYPYPVDEKDDAATVGDEPLLLRRRSKLPVVIGANRPDAAKRLLADYGCDLIVSDDGMQHYSLARDIEICVVDGQRGFANGEILPQGPLREPIERLSSVDFVVVNGTPQPEVAKQIGNVLRGKQDEQANRQIHEMHLLTEPMKPLMPRKERRSNLAVGAVHAIAGIGNPQRFFDALKDQGFSVNSHAFKDHHQFSAKDFNFNEQLPIVMTEKDAVKCTQLDLSNCWYQPIRGELDEDFWQALIERLDHVKTKRAA